MNQDEQLWILEQVDNIKCLNSWFRITNAAKMLWLVVTVSLMSAAACPISEIFKVKDSMSEHSLVLTGRAEQN